MESISSKASKEESKEVKQENVIDKVEENTALEETKESITTGVSIEDNVVTEEAKG